MATKKQQEYDSLRTAQLRRHAAQIAQLAMTHKQQRHDMLLQHRAEREKLDEMLTVAEQQTATLTVVPDA